MRLVALFNYKPAVIEDHLGYNIYQRVHYIQDLEALPTRDWRTFVRLLKLCTSDEELCIVTERSIFSILGFLASKLSKKNYWVVDFVDCPFKEALTYYNKYSLKWLLSLLKSWLVFRLIPYADRIVVSYSPKRFELFYHQDMEKVYYFRNAVPLDAQTYHYAPRRPSDFICMIYVGHDLECFGMEFLKHSLQEYNSKNDRKVKLHIYGHGNPSDSTNDVKYFGRRSRVEVVKALKNTDIGVTAHILGTDVAYVYPIKVVEYFCYCRKLLLSETPGMKGMFAQVDSQDIYYFEPSSTMSFIENLKKCIHDMKTARFDSSRSLRQFSAEEKNAEIAELYRSVGG